MSYQVQVDNFNGPLDLLWNLIEKHELDVCALSLAKICDDYCSYIKQAEALNLELETSYLLIFATLLELKSRMLLPSLPAAENEEAEAGAELLLDRLKHYKQFKLSTENLRARETAAQDFFTRQDRRDDVNLFMEIDSMELWKSLVVIQERLASTQNLIFARPSVIIQQKEKDVWAKIRKFHNLGFMQLLSAHPSRYEISAIFMIILELARRKKIILLQEDLNRPLVVAKADQAPSPPASSIPDEEIASQ